MTGLKQSNKAPIDQLIGVLLEDAEACHGGDLAKAMHTAWQEQRRPDLNALLEEACDLKEESFYALDHFPPSIALAKGDTKTKPRCVIHFGIGNTAHYSVNLAFDYHAKDWVDCYYVNNDIERETYLPQLAKEVNRTKDYRTAYVTGHLTDGFDKYLNVSSIYYAQMRDTYARCYSNYLYFREHGAGELMPKDKSRHMTYGDFLKWAATLQTPHNATTWWMEKLVGARENIQQLCEAFAQKVWVIGIAELFEESLIMLSTEMGLPAVPVWTRTRAVSLKNAEPEPSEEEKAMVHKIYADDFFCYDYFRIRLERWFAGYLETKENRQRYLHYKALCLARDARYARRVLNRRHQALFPSFVFENRAMMAEFENIFFRYLTLRLTNCYEKREEGNQHDTASQA